MFVVGVWWCCFFCDCVCVCVNGYCVFCCVVEDFVGWYLCWVLFGEGVEICC